MMVWNYTTSSPVFSSPAVAGGMVYVVCEDNRVGCLNASTGTLVWNYTVGGWALSSPAVASGCVYAGSEDGYVCCLDASSGALLWSYMAGGQVDCAPAVASGMVYVGSDDGNVYCLEGSTGTLMWSYLTGGAVFSSPAVADGMLYVGSEDGSVYCFGPSQTYVYGVVVCADCYPGDSAVSVPITMDGLPTSHDTPYTFTGLTGTHTFTVPSADADNDSFLDWGNGERNATITVSSGGVYAANYVASGVTVLPVPFRFQDKDYYCGPACLQMVFGYFGRSVLQSEIASVARTVGFPVYGTNDDELRRAAQFSSESTSMGNQLSYNITGYASQPLGCSAFEEYGMNLTVLESFLDQGKPLILMMWYSSSHHDGHFRVAVGYNQTDVFLQDPYNKPLWGSRYGGPVTAFNISQFMDLWSYDDNWALYVVPWNVTFSVPTHVSLGTPFQVQSTVTYPQPLPGAVSTYAASACNASITLPSGLYLVSGDTQTKTLGTGVMQAGSSQSVTWRLIANSSVTGTVSITAEGVISGSVTVYYSYPAYDYSDLIGATSNFAINLSAIHDVAVTEVSSYKSVLCQGYTENVTVIAANLGDYAETFSVTLYANATSIGNITVSNLPSGTSVPIVFVWNAGGFAYGNCTLSAYAWPVPGETNTANNNCTSGWVMVSLAGDVTGPNGWPDGTVDKQDIGAIVKLFGVKYPDPRYNPNFDINGDGRIDMKDVGIAARNFGAHVQPVP
jgi:outer membrane protein assembly factor BamB